MDRVWKSRGRAGSGFGQSGSGWVFANFESRVRVLHGRVSGFCQVYNLCKKVDFFKENVQNCWRKKIFLNFFQIYDSLSSNLHKIFEKK